MERRFCLCGSLRIFNLAIQQARLPGPVQNSRSLHSPVIIMRRITKHSLTGL